MKTHAEFTLKNGKTLFDDFHVYGLYWDDKTLYTYFDDDSNRVLTVDFTKMSMWQYGAFPSSYENPWRGRGNNAPFDQEFFILMNVAVGGTNAYFPDGQGGKPWTN